MSLHTRKQRLAQATKLLKDHLDLHLGDDSPDPISKRAFEKMVHIVADLLGGKR